jgi:hypothetical protein
MLDVVQKCNRIVVGAQQDDPLETGTAGTLTKGEIPWLMGHRYSVARLKAQTG